MRSIKLWIFLFFSFFSFIAPMDLASMFRLETLFFSFFFRECRTLEIKRVLLQQFDVWFSISRNQQSVWLSIVGGSRFSILGQCWDHSIWFIIFVLFFSKFVLLSFCFYPWPSTTRLFVFEVKSKETGDVDDRTIYITYIFFSFSKISIHAWCFVIWKKK